VSSARALVAEPDDEFGKLIAGSLGRAGFQSSRCNSAVEFRIELHSLLLPGVETALIVATDGMLREEAPAVLAAAKTWSRLRSRPVLGVWTTEMGTRGPVAPIDGIELLAVCEKPFDLRDFERIVRGALTRATRDLALVRG
jgi:hypothetical protein